MARNINIIRLLMAVVFSTIAVIAYANGDPVAKFSSVNRVANPEPLSISDIYIIHEKINITHIDGYNCFDITYTFKNKSDKDFQEIHYGFPIDYLVADELETYQFTGDYYSESIAEVGWNEKLIKDIAFTFNGETLSFHSSKESVREAGYIVETYEDYNDSIPVDAVNRRWFYTAFSMKPKAEAKLNVHYKVYANSSVGIYTDYYDFSYFARKKEDSNDIFNNLPFAYRYFSNSFDILYDFTPAKHFGNGAPFVIDVDINLSNLDSPWIRETDGYYYYVNRIERNIYVAAQDIKPINFTVNFRSDRSENSIQRLINQFRIPESEFTTSMTTNTLYIDFHRPMFVSDLVCDVKTSVINKIHSIIEYADGQEKQYEYAIQNISEYLKSDNRIKSPILLTITDLYQDGITWGEECIDFVPQIDGFDKDSFKIKRIKLVFDTDAQQTFLCKKVNVLDTRF